MFVESGLKGNYASLVKNSDRPKCFDKWNNEFISDVHAKEIFDCIFKTKHDSRLRWFQYKLLYSLLPTGQFLYFRKMVNSQGCLFCNHSNETLCYTCFGTDVNCQLFSGCVKLGTQYFYTL